MNRLRHPVRAIREPFGTAGLIVACVALILALTGAAFAAGGLTGKQKKEVEKIAKKFAGKPGAPGAQGPAGANGVNGKDGAPGARGATGPAGSPGSPGAQGATGADGLSPEVVAEGASLCGGKGGVAYEVEGSSEEAEICNGKEGKDGKEGSPWTAGGTLPPGATETGYWSFSEPAGKIKVDVEGTTEEVTIGPPALYVPISFPIKFPFNIKQAHTHYLTTAQANQLAEGLIHGNSGELCEGKTEPELAACEAEQQALHAACPGKFLTPGAAPGELCVYENALQRTQFLALNKAGEGSPGADRAGTVIEFEANTEAAWGWGSFAVTGCEEETGTSECKP